MRGIAGVADAVLVVTAVWLLGLGLLVSAAAVSDNAPVQHRIAFLRDGMTVSWSTGRNLSFPPTVVYGSSPDRLNLTARGVSRHYDTAGSFFHHVELRGLAGRTRYFWQVSTEEADSQPRLSSPVLSFLTAPSQQGPAKGSEGAFTAAVYGDLGIENSADTLQLLRRVRGELDFIHHVGDVAYANAYFRTDETYEEIYEGWMSNMTGIWDQTPYMLCPGNHEVVCKAAGCAVGQHNFTAYRSRFHMPAADSGGFGNIYFSYDYGLAHIIVINTETDFLNSAEGGIAGPFGNAAQWLHDDLAKAAANRERVPWIIVTGHRPFFNDGGDDDDDNSALAGQALRDAFFPIFEQFDIDLIVTAHVHIYQRLYPTHYNGSRCATHYSDVHCPVFIISGAAGNLEGLAPAEPIAPDSVVAVEKSEYGIGVLRVHNSSVFTWQFVRSNDSAILDEIHVVRSRKQRQSIEVE